MSGPSEQPGALPFAIDADVVARLASLAPDPMIAHAGGRVLWANEAAALLMGFESTAAMVGFPVLELVAPESRALVAERMQRMLREGVREPLAPEVFQRRDGARVEVEASAAPIGGGVILVVGRDVTRRNRAERERVTAAVRFRVFFESTSEPMGIVRGDAIVEGNAALAALAGVEGVEELRGRALSSLVAACDRALVASFLRDPERRADASARYVVQLAPGTRGARMVELRLNGFSEHGERFIAAVLRDVTSERAFEERLTRSEQRHRRLFQEVPVALWEEDGTALRALVTRLEAEGVVDLRAHFRAHPEEIAAAARQIGVLAVNEATLALHGARDRIELLGRLHDVFVPEALLGLQEMLAQLAEGAPVAQATTQLGTLDGGLRWVIARLSPVAGHEQDWGRILVSVTDMTRHREDEAERLALGERLRQAERLESVGRLAAGVAHDFNNILTGVLGFAELTLRELDPAGELYDNQVQIRDAALRARNLVQQILTFGQQSRPKPRPIDVGAVVREALGLMRPGLPEGVELDLDLDAAARVAILDPTQLHQVVMNLVSNARDALRERETGRIRVSLERVEAPASWLRLRVADDGPGMDEHTLAHLFEPYMTTKRARGGHGLGLAVVHGIVTGAGGRVEVASAPGRGAVFDVLFPEALGVAATHEAPAAAPQGGGGERILVVEDDPTTRLVHERLLASLGYATEAVEDAEGALALVAQGEPRIHLVLSDQSLPGLSGVELAARLAAHVGAPPVLLCTGLGESAGPSEGEAAQVLGVLQKPLGREALAVAIQAALRSARREADAP